MTSDIAAARAANRTSNGSPSYFYAVARYFPMGCFSAFLLLPTIASIARNIKESDMAAGLEKSTKRTIRRHQLREMVPLADSTIYEMEQRGEFSSWRSPE